MAVNNLKFNMMDVDNLVNKFLLDKQPGIVKLHNNWFKGTDQLSYRALVEELIDVLKTGCIAFINKNNHVEGLDTYLFYITNSFCKKRAILTVKKNTEYLCPGCLFLGKENHITLEKTLSCVECTIQLKKTTDLKWITFFNTFKKHSKLGWRCSDCQRFIPKPLDGSDNVTCPYIDCCFIGEGSSLNKMNHPNSTSNIKHFSMNASKIQVQYQEVDALSKIEIEEEFNNKLKLIKEVIDQQVNSAHWSSVNFTIKHKIFVYQAFKSILEKYPLEMVPYLLDNSRSGGFQHKIFQEYISILESNLPISLKKKKNIYNITSLLDENLSLFEGISTFKAIVTAKGEIKNNTQEFYIGGRKATYTKPYYIGKLLNVIIEDNKYSILHQVKEYSFSKIKLKDVSPGTNVIVTHLRVPPHYQMGGMVYVNRVRKKIIDKVKILLNKNNE
jgi:hypothetical protein